MTNCKHDWHFIEGTDRLQCARCKAETGPRTPDQLMQDLLSDVTLFGMAWQKGGKRIDLEQLVEDMVSAFEEQP